MHTYILEIQFIVVVVIASVVVIATVAVVVVIASVVIATVVVVVVVAIDVLVTVFTVVVIVVGVVDLVAVIVVNFCCCGCYCCWSDDEVKRKCSQQLIYAGCRLPFGLRGI